MRLYGLPSRRFRGRGEGEAVAAVISLRSLRTESRGTCLASLLGMPSWLDWLARHRS